MIPDRRLTASIDAIDSAHRAPREQETQLKRLARTEEALARAYQENRELTATAIMLQNLAVDEFEHAEHDTSYILDSEPENTFEDMLEAMGSMDGDENGQLQPTSRTPLRRRRRQPWQKNGQASSVVRRTPVGGTGRTPPKESGQLSFEMGLDGLGGFVEDGAKVSRLGFLRCVWE